MEYKGIEVPDHLTNDIYVEIDGFHVFGTSKGFMTSYNLRYLADLLDKLNEPWNKQIENYLVNGVPDDL